ncbi:hypothetical protein [Algoriphagus boritolerans]|uniref:Uncharacterized protein n=1 Tax=Algoriphagus boritolerans DSM 17298 = JCM 18970 TaxID=1120964 RepID=A0A1H5XHS4_9BACT|nr:hypothetical protein [Algoriphagus boritolerans]SEG10970.1 hypothetical protein SAMN03080598_02525 [Algoriphagus boritolerans DSM 17298 = JCM 18970]
MERNKGDTEEKPIPILIPEEEAQRFRIALIRLLERIEVQASDQVQLDDIKEVFKLLEHFSKQD